MRALIFLARYTTLEYTRNRKTCERLSRFVGWFGYGCKYEPAFSASLRLSTLDAALCRDPEISPTCTYICATAPLNSLPLGGSYPRKLSSSSHLATARNEYHLSLTGPEIYIRCPVQSSPVPVQASTVQETVGGWRGPSDLQLCLRPSCLGNKTVPFGFFF